MADLDALALGTPVRFKRPLRRACPPATPRRKVWEPDPYMTGTYGGIVVGLRTLSDGETFGGWDEPLTYRPARHYRAVLVVEGLHRKPVLVLPDDVEVIQ
jgi:hypothetical protein